MIPLIQYNNEEGKALTEKLLQRNNGDYVEQQATVDEIIREVKQYGDAALFAYTEKLDHFSLTKENLLVTEAEINEAYDIVSKSSPDLIDVIRKAAERIRSFHNRQKQNSWFETRDTGEILGQMVRPITRCGVYVPGGKAAYPSTVLMNVIPAQVAGVSSIIMSTPCNAAGKVNPATLVTANEAGVKTIFKIGGAQAVAAMAFGTESVPRVDKIVGPGNIYVALAKRSVYGYVDIDSVAGPSEILVIADENANPAYVAADLLSQAEHDEMASAILVTPSRSLAEDVLRMLEQQTEQLSRKAIIRQSLTNYGAAFLVDDLEEAVKLSNTIAPEHLEICTAEPFSLLPLIQNAGAVFLGYYTSEPLGDYMAGPNHVLPTGGTARFYSPLSVDDFVKKTSVLSFTREAMKHIGSDVVKFAEAEGLTAHANAVKVRLEKNPKEDSK